MEVHGGCACGAVRYALHRDDLPKVYCCHCRDCQSRSGSAFCEIAVIGTNELEITGYLVTSTSRLPSGSQVDNSACRTCLSPIFTAYPGYPNKLLLRAGTFDDCDWIVPVAHIFTSQKQPWVNLPNNVLAYEHAQPPDFAKLVGFV